MERKEWLERCAARFVERAEVSQEFAAECALAAYEEGDEIYEDFTPEEAADEEMSYWGD